MLSFEVPFDPEELEKLRRQQNPRKYGPRDQPQQQPEIREDDSWSRRPEMPSIDKPTQTGGNVTIIQLGEMVGDDEPRDKENRRPKK